MHTSLVAKKSLGQHFLKNPRVVARMIETAKLKRGDVVLEVGPGTGVLTAGLLETGARVIAVEADKRAVDILRGRFSDRIETGQLVLHHADVREKAPASFVPERTPYSIVANIPYYLSGMLIRSALSASHQPDKIVFLVQKEVADRIARTKNNKKKESLLSLSVKVYGKPRYVATVSKGNFSPAPKVDSAILAVEDISRIRLKDTGEAWFFEVLHAGFASRRKQLLGNLTALCKKTTLIRHFEALGIPPDVRGEDLPIGTWLSLARMLEPISK